jgi:hypothetical protein
VELFFSLKDAAEKSVSDEAFAKRSERWADDAGCSTKEAYFYRDIFECELAGVRGVLVVVCHWQPADDDLD